VFTARYALSPYIKQMGFVFKGLIKSCVWQLFIGIFFVWNVTRSIIFSCSALFRRQRRLRVCTVWRSPNSPDTWYTLTFSSPMAKLYWILPGPYHSTLPNFLLPSSGQGDAVCKGVRWSLCRARMCFTEFGLLKGSCDKIWSRLLNRGYQEKWFWGQDRTM
jgi:hypothetical protein